MATVGTSEGATQELGHALSPTSFPPSSNNLPGVGAPTVRRVPPGFTGTPSQGEFAGTAGHSKPLHTERLPLPDPSNEGEPALFLQGNYELSNTIDLFAEFMYFAKMS